MPTGFVRWYDARTAYAFRPGYPDRADDALKAPPGILADLREAIDEHDVVILSGLPKHAKTFNALCLARDREERGKGKSFYAQPQALEIPKLAADLDLFNDEAPLWILDEALSDDAATRALVERASSRHKVLLIDRDAPELKRRLRPVGRALGHIDLRLSWWSVRRAVAATGLDVPESLLSERFREAERLRVGIDGLIASLRRDPTRSVSGADLVRDAADGLTPEEMALALAVAHLNFLWVVVPSPDTELRARVGRLNQRQLDVKIVRGVRQEYIRMDDAHARALGALAFEKEPQLVESFARPVRQLLLKDSPNLLSFACENLRLRTYSDLYEWCSISTRPPSGSLLRPFLADAREGVERALTDTRVTPNVAVRIVAALSEDDPARARELVKSAWPHITTVLQTPERIGLYGWTALRELSQVSEEVRAALKSALSSRFAGLRSADPMVRAEVIWVARELDPDVGRDLLRRELSECSAIRFWSALERIAVASRGAAANEVNELLAATPEPRLREMLYANPVGAWDCMRDMPNKDRPERQTFLKEVARAMLVLPTDSEAEGWSPRASLSLTKLASLAGVRIGHVPAIVSAIRRAVETGTWGVIDDLGASIPNWESALKDVAKPALLMRVKIDPEIGGNCVRALASVDLKLAVGAVDELLAAPAIWSELRAARAFWVLWSVMCSLYFPRRGSAPEAFGRVRELAAKLEPIEGQAPDWYGLALSGLRIYARGITAPPSLTGLNLPLPPVDMPVPGPIPVSTAAMFALSADTALPLAAKRELADRLSVQLSRDTRRLRESDQRLMLALRRAGERRLKEQGQTSLASVAVPATTVD